MMPAPLSRALLRFAPACFVAAAAIIVLAPASVRSQAESPGPLVSRSETPATFAGPVPREALTSGWSYRADPQSVGTAEGWETGEGSEGWVPVRLPHVANALPVTGRAGARSFRGSVGWYRRDLKVSEAGSYVIRFESVHHRARVWLDGQELPSHVGAYEAFEYEVGLQPADAHRLVVRVDWRSPTRMKREGWHRGWFNFGGINREVTIRPAGPSELSSPGVVTNVLPDGRALVNLGVRVRNRRQTRDIPVRAALIRNGQRIEIPMSAPPLPGGASGRARGQVTIDAPALWSPSHPNLYELQLSVPGETAYRARVGLREITRRNGRLELNGSRLVLRGASLQEEAYGHGDALTPADQDALVDDLRELGANATRAQHPLDSGLLERLDAAGILLWQHIGPWDAPGNWTSRTTAAKRRARARARRTVAAQRIHPSILAWNLANEVAGGGHPAGQIDYIDGMARELHRGDPGRLVAVDIWGKHPPRRRSKLYRNVDAIGITSYIGWYEQPFATSSQVAAASRARIASLRGLFPGKVLAVTEFGAEGNGDNPRDRHGGYGYQARVIGTHLRTYRVHPEVSGMLVWALRDFSLQQSFAGGSISSLVGRINLVPGINQKGIFDVRRRPKPVASVVRSEFSLARAASPAG